MYVAVRQLKVGDRVVQPGEPVPEAEGWKNLRAYVSAGQIKLAGVEELEAEVARLREQWAEAVNAQPDPARLMELEELQTRATDTIAAQKAQLDEAVAKADDLAAELARATDTTSAQAAALQEQGEALAAATARAAALDAELEALRKAPEPDAKAKAGKGK